MRGLSLVAASGGHSSLRCAGLSVSRPPLLWSTGSRRAGSVVAAHGPGRSAACGIFPDQGLNPCPLHWQADSQPLRHQGSPQCAFNMNLLLSLDKSILDIICLHPIRVVENYNFLIASSRFLPFHLPELLLEFWVKSICSVFATVTT